MTPTWAVLALAVGVGLLLLAAVALPVLGGPLWLAASLPALAASAAGLRLAHPVDPSRGRRIPDPEEAERGRRDAERDQQRPGDQR